MLRLVGEAAQRAAPAVAARHRRQRSFECGCVAAEDVRYAADVVEANECVGDDESALREAGALVRQRHGRLELRDVVVRDVADDRQPERLGLVQRHEPRTGADERVAAQATLLHRLEQERAAAAVAQAEVGPERGEQVGCDSGRHCKQKRP